MKTENLNEYVLNMRVQGYGNLAMNVKVPAHDPDEALDLACRQEPRYLDTDPYLLLVVVNEEGEESVFCTYSDLETALNHCETITNGEWYLVEREQPDEESEQAGIIVKSWSDFD